MSIEQKIEELTAAIRENTEALRAAGAAPKAAATNTASDEAAPASKPGRKPKAAAEAETTKPKGYEAKYTKAQAQAAANEVKEQKGVAVAKGIIAELGFTKLAEIEKAEDIDRLYERCKQELEGDGAGEGDDDDM